MKNFFAFSGLDGAGKSTQIAALDELLSSKNQQTKIVWSRGGYTPFFQFLKSSLRKSSTSIIPKAGKSEKRNTYFEKPLIRKAWLTIAIFDLFFLYAIYFRWCKMTGRTIIADRYIEDTIIDFRLNFTQERVENWMLFKFLSLFFPTPEKHFLLLIPVEESLRRSKLKNEPFPDSPETLQSRLDMYKDYLNKKSHFVEINCLGTPNEVSQEIFDKLSI